MGPALLVTNGAQPQKNTRYASVFTSRFFAGLWTNRNPLRSPLSAYYAEGWHLGGTDALLSGVNVELTTRLTFARRPGTFPFSSALSTYPPDRFYTFHETASPGNSTTIRDVVDSADSINYFNSSSKTLIYLKAPVGSSGAYAIAAVDTGTGSQSGLPTWSNVNNIIGAPNSQYASTVASRFDNSSFLNVTFNTNLIKVLRVPSDSAMTGFQFTVIGHFVEGTLPGGSLSTTVQVQLLINGTAVGVAKTSSAISDSSDMSLTFGSPTDLWGTAALITAAIVNGGSTLGVQIQCQNNALNGGTFFIDAVEVIVSYTDSLNGSFFQGVGQTLYWGDGINQLKWNDFGIGVPGNNNGNVQNPTWGIGIAAPTVAPAVTITPSGAAAVLWQASSVYSTMGFIVDSNNNIQQLISVNASGLNPSSQYGLASNGQPAWNQTPGLTTTDNSITWTNRGPVGQWAAGATFNNASLSGSTTNPACIYDPVSNAVYLNIRPGNLPGTTGSVKPSFNGIFGSTYQDGTVKWFCAGLYLPWKPSTAYPTWAGNDHPNTAIVEPVALPAPNNQVVFLQTSGGGTSGAGTVGPSWAITVGTQTQDNQLVWLNLGTATWGAITQYVSWSGPGQPVFSAIEDSNGNFQVCIVSGTSGASTPTWGTNYGDSTVDGTVTWACVGNSMTWIAGANWYLPVSGFSPPQPGSPYGSASVVDSNNDVEFVTGSGVSQTPGPPAWAAIGSPTTDGTVTWTNVSAYSQNSLSWTKGYGYAFAFKARAAGDAYVTTAPPGQAAPLGPPTGSASGAVSSISPVFQMPIAPNAGSVNTISGLGSLDPQYDTISIFRTADGGGNTGVTGGVPILLFLTDIKGPAAIGGVAQPWSFQDTLPDTDLNILIPAPANQINNQPPVGLINLTYHMSRIWGSVGNVVYASAGPLVSGPGLPPGNGNESWPPNQYFTFQSTVIRLVPITSGLIVWTESNIEIITGGPSNSSLSGVASFAAFYSQPLVQGLGIISYDAVGIQGGVTYAFTSDSQCVSVDPSMGLSQVGFPIGDQLQQFAPANVFLTYHISGALDNALYVADGSTGWYRCNPNQAPDAAITGPVWSPKANIIGGCGAISTMEITPGVHQLLIGGTGMNEPILARDSSFSFFSDAGNAYPANFVMGNIVLANPGQVAEMRFVTMDFIGIGSQPTVSVLLGEISGIFSNISGYVKNDPPRLPPSKSLYSNRYYFKQSVNGENPPPAWCRHMQLSVDFGMDTVQNELLTATINGAIHVE